MFRRLDALEPRMTNTTKPAQSSGTFRIGGELEVNRLGYGTMQLTGPGVWGPPKDHDEAIRVLRRSVDRAPPAVA